MTVMTKLSRLLIVFLVAFSLAACESSEERAEAYYQSALELLEAGDTARAIVELRNVFQLNESHRDARRLMADIFLQQNNLPDAYGQYLRLVEQYPEEVEALRRFVDDELEP